MCVLDNNVMCSQIHSAPRTRDIDLWFTQRQEHGILTCGSLSAKNTDIDLWFTQRQEHGILTCGSLSAKNTDIDLWFTQRQEHGYWPVVHSAPRTRILTCGRPCNQVCTVHGPVLLNSHLHVNVTMEILTAVRYENGNLYPDCHIQVCCGSNRL